MRRLAWLALLLAACSAQPVASPNSAARSAPSISSCRLPVRTVVSGGKLQVGFLTVPGGTFTPVTNAQEGLYYYNRRVGRWVAWAPEALFEDGSTYAYVEGD